MSTAGGANALHAAAAAQSVGGRWRMRNTGRARSRAMARLSESSKFILGHGARENSDGQLSPGSPGSLQMRAPHQPLRRRFSAWGSSNSIAPDSVQGEDSAVKATVLPKDPAQEHEVTSLMDTMMMMKKSEAGPWYLIDPRHSVAMKLWDVVTCTALLFTAVITPYEVGFLPPPQSSMELLFIVNRIIDIVFLIDIVVHFMLMYPATDSDQSVIWVQSPKKIMVHYLKTWFLIDTVSSLVSITDIVAVYEQGTSGQCSPSPLPLLSTLALTLISTRRTRPPSPSTLALILLHACSLIAAVTARRLPPATAAPNSVGTVPRGRL